MQKQLSRENRERLKGLGYRWTGHQVPLKDGRKLDRVTEPHDPWCVTIYRDGVASWANGALIAHEKADTLDLAISKALDSVRARRCAGGLLKVMADLEVEIDILAHSMRGEVPF